MSVFRILNANLHDDRQEWLTTWAGWQQREVWAHPDYVRLFTKLGEAPLCAMLRTKSGGALLPMIQRRLSGEPWAEEFYGLSDVTSPYGYGGPFTWGEPDLAAWWTRIREWARSAGVVSVFLRLSLDWTRELPREASVDVRRMNVVRTLQHDEAFIWNSYEHKVRKNVNTAKRAGLVIEIDPSGQKVDAFRSIYRATLERRGADSRYDFPDAFFERMLDDLRGQYTFFHAVGERGVVASELVLISTSAIYSFLGGTLASAYALRPNDLLKHEIILWGREHGKRVFVLGGGYVDGDGIFRYKKAFASDGLVPFRTASMITEPRAYRALVAARAAWELGQARSWSPTDYFPGYRAAAVEAGKHAPSVTGNDADRAVHGRAAFGPIVS